MEFVTQNAVVLWFVAGGVLLVLEATAPGIGMLFGGLGAITAGLVLWAGLVDAPNLLVQFAVFCGTTILWTALLWRELKKYYAPKGKAYNNMIGTQATLLAGLEPGQMGRARWSGTDMHARLADGQETAEEGRMLYVHDVDGNTLILSKNKPE